MGSLGVAVSTLRPTGEWDIPREVPLFDDDLCFAEGVEDFPVQQLIPYRSVEALAKTGFPWCLRFDVCGSCSDICNPIPNSTSNEPGAVV